MQAPDFWRHDGLNARLLAPAASLFGAVGWWRMALARPVAVEVPVLCVGNLVAGGAGKTPVALALLRILAERGIAAHVLSRGYGGKLKGPVRVEPGRHSWREVGDEPLLLAAEAPTWVARDRLAGARAAIAAGAQAIVMDDGFQNPTLAKDLSLVVVDGGYGFGNGKIMPAGPMRESIHAGLARADAAILVGDDRHGLSRSLPGRLPMLRAHLQPRHAESWDGRRVFAFAGIGRPQKFFETLRGAGASIAAMESFPDHHPYTMADLAPLLSRAEALDAVPVTTAKDRIRLPPEVATQVEVLEVDLVWTEDRDRAQIEAALDRAWRKR